MNTPQLPNTENARIRQAYLRRERIVPRDRYSVFKDENLIARQQLERQIVGLLRRHGHAQLEQKKILDVGCGTGFWLRQFVQWGANPKNLVGIDLLPERIDRGGELCASGVTLRCGDASHLDFEDHAFDVVLQFTVFSSVLDQATRTNLADQIRRVMKPSGILLWLDFFVSNPKNPDVRGVTRREIRQLFPGCTVDLERVILAPPLARLIAPLSQPLCRLLSAVKPLCTYYVGIIRRS